MEKTDVTKTDDVKVDEMKTEKIKREKPKLSRTAKIVLIVITIVAGLLVIGGLNKVHPSPFSASVKSVYRLDVATKDQGGVVVDDQGKRLLFTDTEGRLVNIVDLTKSGSPINRAVRVAIEGDKARVHGCYTIQEGMYLSSESLVDYSLKGELIGEVYRQDYDEDTLVTKLQIETDDAKVYDGTISSEAINRTVTINYSVWYLIKNIIYWLGVLWIAAAVLWLVIYLVANKLKGKSVAVAVGIGCILFTAVFYTAQNYKQIRAVYENAVSTTTRQCAAEMSESEGDKLAEISRGVSEQGIGYINQPQAQEYITGLQQRISTYCGISGTLHSYGINIVIYDDSGRIYELADSRGVIPAGTEIILTEEERKNVAKHDSKDVIYLSGTVADILTDFEYIRDGEGNAVAIVESMAYEDNVLATQSEKGTDIFITLLALFIGIYMVINLYFVFSADLKRWGSKPKSDFGRSADMSGIYMFIYKLASTIDEVITVYVASSLCVGMDPAKEAVMVAIPLTALSLGRWVGTFLATPIIKKLGERLSGIFGCITGLGSVAIILLSIQTSNIYIYSLGKAVWGFGLGGLLFVVSDLLPLNASNEAQRVEAMNSSQQSVSAAGIITALLSGFISQYVGYSLVYVISGIMTAIMLILTCMTFGKKGTNGQGAEKEDVQENPGVNRNMKDCWTVFLKPEMLIYVICYIVPVVLTGGYSIYLFPLYSSGAGISVMLLSNINVFSKTITYVANAPIKKFTEKFKSTQVMVIPQLIACAGLLCFIISPNIYWAIIMLFAIDLLNRTTRVHSNMYRVKVAELYGLDDKLVVSNFYTVQSALYIVQSPILSAFMTLGANPACAAVGGVCGALFAIFGGYARKSINSNNICRS